MKRGFLKATLQIVVMFALMYSCLYLLIQAIEADTRDELLTREQKAEVMSRQYSDLEREEHIDMADRILAARVEREWREKQ